MKKQRFILIAAALAAVSLSSACSQTNDSESSDISANSVDIGTSSTQSISDSSDISSNLIDSSQDESESSVEKIPVEFSEEDREVQKMLSDMRKPANELYDWTQVPPISYPKYKFRFPDDKSEPSVYRPFSGAHESEDHLFERPDTYSELKELLLEYFSADKTEALLHSFGFFTAVENADGTYTLKSADGSHIEYLPGLIEVDGKLYRDEGIGIGYIAIDLDTVKVSSKTDDAIEFTYIYDSWDRPFDTSTYLSDITFYSERASNGTLKYERGGWKLDSWLY